MLLPVLVPAAGTPGHFRARIHFFDGRTTQKKGGPEGRPCVLPACPLRERDFFFNLPGSGSGRLRFAAMLDRRGDFSGCCRGDRGALSTGSRNLELLDQIKFM